MFSLLTISRRFDFQSIYKSQDESINEDQRFESRFWIFTYGFIFFLLPVLTVGKVAYHFTVGISRIIQIGCSLILRFSVKHLSSTSIKYWNIFLGLTPNGGSHNYGFLLALVPLLAGQLYNITELNCLETMRKRCHFCCKNCVIYNLNLLAYHSYLEHWGTIFFDIFFLVFRCKEPGHVEIWNHLQVSKLLKRLRYSVH